MTEGYIKYHCDWEKEAFAIPKDQLDVLTTARRQLYDLGLIGVYPDGIGFGNISVREGQGNSFIITGSATGQFNELEPKHYARVTDYSFSGNSLSCIGLTKASAESLSHAAVYEMLPEVGGVVHVHCLWLWERLLYHYPTTATAFEYGTPEMAEAIGQLVLKMKNTDDKFVVMGGHREGILTFGNTLNDATNEILKIYNQYKHD